MRAACLLSLSRRFVRDERGNIALLFGVFMALGTVAGAFAVDEGSLYLQRRVAQSAVDLAAVEAAADPPDAFALARRALADAGLVDPAISDAALTDPAAPNRLGVDVGGYTADSALAVGQRYQAGAGPTNAAHVHFTTRGELLFAQSWGKAPAISVDAVASTVPQVTFSVGSTLAELTGGVPNAILNSLLGANVSLSAVSYNGLLNTQVGLFGFLDALAQELSIHAGTYDDVLAASADQGTIAKAIADATNGPDAIAALALAQALGHNGRLSLSRLLDLGEAGNLAIGSGASSGYAASLSALELLAASGAVSDGTHEVSLNLAANVPGLASLTMELAVGEPAQFATWFALGPSGTIARTAQIRLRFVATLAGGTGLLGAGVRVPLYLEVAFAQAAVASATCPAAGAANGSAVIAAEPGVARLVLGDVGDPAFGDFGQAPAVAPATLVSLGPLQVTGSAVASIAQDTPVLLGFSAADVAAGTVKRATTTTYTQSLITSLLQNLTLGVHTGPLPGLSAQGTGNAVAAVIAPLAPVLDATIASTLATLGLSLGDADVEVYQVRCSHPVLVR